MSKEIVLKPWEKWYVTRIVWEIKSAWISELNKINNDFKTEVENKLTTISEKMDEIVDFHKDLIDWTDGKEPIKSEIQWYLEELSDKLNSIKEKYDSLIEWEDWIIKNHEKSSITKDKIEDLLDELNPLIENFNIYYDKVFWTKDENWKTVWWLKNEIEEKNKEFIALKEKIEWLLPWATSAWLAYAYEKYKKSFYREKWIRSLIFIVAILWMLVSYLLYNPEWPEITERWWILVKFIIRFPITVPFIWLALFSGKQQNKYQRLEQEYAYKESLSRSFEWYRREIDKINNLETAKQLQINLLNVIVQMSSYNPSNTLESPSNNEKSPYSTFMDSAPKAIEKVWSVLK